MLREVFKAYRLDFKTQDNSQICLTAVSKLQDYHTQVKVWSFDGKKQIKEFSTNFSKILECFTKQIQSLQQIHFIFSESNRSVSAIK